MAQNQHDPQNLEAWQKLDAYRISLGLPEIASMAMLPKPIEIPEEYRPVSYGIQEQQVKVTKPSFEVDLSKQPSMYTPQQIIRLEVSTRPNSDHEQRQVLYEVHDGFLLFHAENLRQRVERDQISQEYLPVKLHSPFPSAFGNYLEWLYTQTLPAGDALNHREWIALWTVAECCGTPKLQSELFRKLEDNRLHGRFEPIYQGFLSKVLEATTSSSLVRQYIVETWDPDLQTLPVKRYPQTFMAQLAGVLINRFNGVGAINIERNKYLLEEEGLLNSSPLHDEANVVHGQHASLKPPNITTKILAIDKAEIDHDPTGRPTEVITPEKQTKKVRIKQEQDGKESNAIDQDRTDVAVERQSQSDNPSWKRRANEQARAESKSFANKIWESHMSKTVASRNQNDT